jgi:hypothetical protein
MFPGCDVEMIERNIDRAHAVGTPDDVPLDPPASEVKRVIGEVIEKIHPGWKPWQPIRVELPLSFDEAATKYLYRTLSRYLGEKPVISRSKVGALIVDVPERRDPTVEGWIRDLCGDVLKGEKGPTDENQ